jgi:hypothetical protein
MSKWNDVKTTPKQPQLLVKKDDDRCLPHKAISTKRERESKSQTTARYSPAVQLLSKMQKTNASSRLVICSAAGCISIVYLHHARHLALSVCILSVEIINLVGHSILVLQFANIQKMQGCHFIRTKHDVP